MQVAAEMINKKVLAWGKLLLNCNFYCLVVVPLPIHVEYHDPIHVSCLQNLAKTGGFSPSSSEITVSKTYEAPLKSGDKTDVPK
jgi:hypothetical protein